MEKKERYFIIFYSATFKDGKQGTGTAAIASNGFLNAKETNDKICSRHEFTGLSFNGILEINKQDYESWNK